MNLDLSIGGEVQCFLKTHVLFTSYGTKETLFICHQFYLSVLKGLKEYSRKIYQDHKCLF